MKGESAVPRPLRAIANINQFIAAHAAEPSGALAETLNLWAKNDSRVSRQLDSPLTALDQIIESLLTESTVFYEFSRQVMIAQATLTGERPRFQAPNQLPHPEAEQTHDSIRTELSALLEQLKQEDL